MLTLKKIEDKSIYVLTDGSRGFTSTVSGIDPVQDYHLTTKSYVDGQDEYYKQELLDIIGQNKSGNVGLSNGDSSTSVVFTSPFTADDYALFVSIENTIDSPASEYALTITDKSTTGFTVNYSGDIDSSNYTLNWLATLSGSFGGSNYLSSVINDDSPELGGNLELNNYSLVLNTTPSGNFVHGYTVGWSGEISTVYIADNYEIGSPLYVKSNGGFALCTAASGTIQMPCVALAIEEGTGNKKILWKGIMRKDTWSWTAGDVIYISTVEGALTKVVPSDTGEWQQAVGVALGSNTIRFDPGYNPGKIN